MQSNQKVATSRTKNQETASESQLKKVDISYYGRFVPLSIRQLVDSAVMKINNNRYPLPWTSHKTQHPLIRNTLEIRKTTGLGYLRP